MLHIDLTLDSPEENLACDEALLDLCEAGFPEGVLRFWSPKETFVVVGYANQVAVEVNEPECQRVGVPILRRCTGGGTVVQAPGCLNYTVILHINSHAGLAGIPGTNDYVMERNRSAVEFAARVPIQREGFTDLALDGRKFCGNAQRRRRHCLIFHGCFLLSCDLGLMEQLLLMPSKQPEYRKSRSHLDFVTNLQCPAGDLKESLKREWQAAGALRDVPLEQIRKLASEKYNKADWNRKF